MRKRIQQLVTSSLFVLSIGTIGAIIAEVSVGTLYAPACPDCDERRGCAGSPAGVCVCPTLGSVCTVAPP